MATDLPDALRRSLTFVVGQNHILTGDDATAGFAVDWTGRFRGRAAAVVRPGDTAEIARVLALCADAGSRWCRRAGTPAWSAAASRCTARWCSA